VSRLVTEPTLKTEIERLLAAKRAGAELDRGPRIAPISAFIESELQRWETHTITGYRNATSNEKLDELFRESLEEVWAS
jgi:predicted nucleotidyltransferase